MTQMNHGLQKGDLALPFARGKSIAINNHFDSPCSRHLYKGDAGHDGLDWPVGEGTPVHAMYGGTVYRVQLNPIADEYGIWVGIRSLTNASTDSGFEHAYAHLSALDVYVGQTVEKGDRLGWSGHTSKDRVGNHLHVGLRPYVGTNRQTAPREYTIPDENRDLKPNDVVLWGRIDFRRFLEGAEDDTIASWRDQQNVIQGHYLIQRTGPHVVTTLVTVPTGGVNIRDSAMLFTVPAHSRPISPVQGRKLAATPKEEDTPYVQVSTEGYVSHDGKRNRDENLTSPMSYCGDLAWTAHDALAPTAPTAEPVRKQITLYAFLTARVRTEVRSNPDASSSRQAYIDPKKDYPVVGRHPADGTASWWQVSLPSGMQGWVSASDATVTNERNMPRLQPPTGLDYTTPDEETLTLHWVASASSGITGYRIWGLHVPAPLAIVKADTGSAATKWTSKGRLPCYDHLYYRVAALRGNEVGQLSTTLIVQPAIVRLRPGGTETVRQQPAANQTVVDRLQRGDHRCYAIVGRYRENPLWWQIRLPDGRSDRGR